MFQAVDRFLDGINSLIHALEVQFAGSRAQDALAESGSG
jgi:hypothetical protein